MEFVLKRTDQLADTEKKGICDLFYEVFGKEKTLERFDWQFLQTVKGYSYHGMMMDGNKIAGCYAAIPFGYSFFGKNTVFALSVDTMIGQDYRGNIINLKRMAAKVYDALKEDGIPFVFGFPNENIYLVRKKVLRWKDIGHLNFYALPRRIGALKSSLSALNPLSATFVRLVNMAPKDASRYGRIRGADSNIEIIKNEAWRRYRFADSEVVTLVDDAYFAYKVESVDNVRTAYLMDVYPLEKGLVESAVKYICKKEGAYIDIVLYVGKLDFRPVNLYRVPEKFNPKTVYMSGLLLLDGQVDERVFDINSWNVNLSNFDVV